MSDEQTPTLHGSMSIIESLVISSIVVPLCITLFVTVIHTEASGKRVVYHLAPSRYNYLDPRVEAWQFVALCTVGFAACQLTFLLVFRQLLPASWKNALPLFGPSKSKLLPLFVVAIVTWTFLFILLIAFLEVFINPRVPTPIWIPRSLLIETHRVQHPEGYSIIVDPEWTVEILKKDPYPLIGSSDDFKHLSCGWTGEPYLAKKDEKGRFIGSMIHNAIIAYPHRDLRGTMQPFFSVLRLSEKPAIAETLQATTFQGKPAYERFLPEAKTPPRQCCYEILFRRGERWYRIAWYKPVSELEAKTLHEPPAIIRELCATFRESGS